MDDTVSPAEVNPIVDEIDAALESIAATLAQAEAKIAAAEEVRAKKTPPPPAPEEAGDLPYIPRAVKERRTAEWKALDAAIAPYLYLFARYAIEWAGGLSLNGGYWINPKLNVKLCLKTGNVFYYGQIVGNYFHLWLIHLGLERYDLPRARELLREWIAAQALEV